MIVSLNEIEGTVTKAARGAGYAWGLAEEAAFCARWLAVNELGWLVPMVRLLERPRAELAVAAIDLAGHALASPAGGLPLDPLVAGAALSDVARLLTGDPAGIHIGLVAEPILLVPFAARVARAQDVAVRVGWEGANLLVGAESVSVGRNARLDGALAQAVTVSAVEGPAPRLHAPHPGGRKVEQAYWARLSALEALTYVPASEASRIAGAGAGLSDND